MKKVNPEETLAELSTLSDKQKRDVQATLKCWGTDSLMPDDIDEASISSALALFVVYGYPQSLQVIERAMEKENVHMSE